jgi:hypothetical protein
VKASNIERDNRVTLLIDDGYVRHGEGKAKINRERDVKKESQKLAIR